jgi:hypothetical protein
VAYRPAVTVTAGRTQMITTCDRDQLELSPRLASNFDLKPERKVTLVVNVKCPAGWPGDTVAMTHGSLMTFMPSRSDRRVVRPMDRHGVP